MATLKNNGTELARFEYETGTIVVMSNGYILRNRGSGWTRYRKAKPGVDPMTIAEERRNSFNRRRAACPNWDRYVTQLCKLVSLQDRVLLAQAIALMPDDPDGVWSEMDDRGCNLDLSEIVELMQWHKLGRPEVVAYLENE